MNHLQNILPLYQCIGKRNLLRSQNTSIVHVYANANVFHTGISLCLLTALLTQAN